MIRLGVNLDHVATLRQARRARVPELVAAAHAAMLGGADQITLHLREDRRHVQDADLDAMAAIDADLNLEMAATDEMVAIATRLRPQRACLVPEKRQELTTEGGLDVVRGDRARLSATIESLRAAGISVSLFVEPAEEALLASNEVGAEAVELHTGRYANATTEAARVHEFLALQRAAVTAKQLGLRVHAGHGLDYRNVVRVAAIPEVEELNIGFAIVARAVFVGLTEAVREMRTLLWRVRDPLRETS